MSEKVETARVRQSYEFHARVKEASRAFGNETELFVKPSSFLRTMACAACLLLQTGKTHGDSILRKNFKETG